MLLLKLFEGKNFMTLIFQVSLVRVLQELHKVHRYMVHYHGDDEIFGEQIGPQSMKLEGSDI